MPSEVVDWGDCRVGVNVNWDEISVDELYLRFWELGEIYSPVLIVDAELQFREFDGILNNIELIVSGQVLQFRLANGSLSNVSTTYEDD